MNVVFAMPLVSERVADVRLDQCQLRKSPER